MNDKPCSVCTGIDGMKFGRILWEEKCPHPFPDECDLMPAGANIIQFLLFNGKEPCYKFSLDKDEELPDNRYD